MRTIDAVYKCTDIYINNLPVMVDKADTYKALAELPSAQPEQHYDEWCTDCQEYDKERHCCPRWNKVIRQTLDEAQQSQWIPCSEPPKESGTYIVTAYDGTDKRVTFVKYQKTLKRWDLTGARAYWRILAYKPLPEPWRGANS